MVKISSKDRVEWVDQKDHKKLRDILWQMCDGDKRTNDGKESLSWLLMDIAGWCLYDAVPGQRVRHKNIFEIEILS